MSDNKKQLNQRLLDRLAPIVIGLPWIEIMASAWKIGRKMFQGLAYEGMYEVLEYKSTLELKNIRGEKAVFSKEPKSPLPAK